MKDEHPPEILVTKVTCGCGNSFLTQHPAGIEDRYLQRRHPFYTGKLKYVDTAGRIKKFQKKFAATGYASLNRGKKPAKTEAADRSGQVIGGY